MKKLLSLFTLIISISTFAQGLQNDSIKAKIREIKLSEQCVYAESTTTSSPTEAKTLAMEELQANAVSLLSELRKSKAEIEKAWKEAEEQSSILEYQSGNLFKVFTYVSKKCLTGESEKQLITEPVINTTYTQTPVAEANPKEEPQAPVEASSTDDPAMPSEKTFNSTDENTAKLLMDILNPGQNKPLTPIESIPEKEKSEETVVPNPVKIEETITQPQEIETPTSNPLNNLSEASRKALNDLLALDTYQSVMLYLSAMKEDGRLMYGRINSLISPEKAYLVIIKNGQLVTVLNKGTDERINLKSLQKESVKKYLGHGIIWLKLFN